MRIAQRTKKQRNQKKKQTKEQKDREQKKENKTKYRKKEKKKKHYMSRPPQLYRLPLLAPQRITFYTPTYIKTS